MFDKNFFIMDNYPAVDTPPTIDFQKGLKPIQDEYKKAYISGTHDDIEFFKHFELYGYDYFKKCELIYNHKVLDLRDKIKDNVKYRDYLKKIKVKIRFEELVSDAIKQTFYFLEK